MEKEGQLKISFGMIFSIILIIVFVSFAFFAITKFVDIGKSVEVGKFLDDLQKDVDTAWRGSQASVEREYFLPEKIELVCFGNFTGSEKGRNAKLFSDLRRVFYERENMIFYPIGSGEGLDAREIKHIDISNMITSENPFCLENLNGKISLTIKKNFGENLVTISR